MALFTVDGNLQSCPNQVVYTQLHTFRAIPHVRMLLKSRVADIHCALPNAAPIAPRKPNRVGT